jgi:hypothetical protein
VPWGFLSGLIFLWNCSRSNLRGGQGQGNPENPATGAWLSREGGCLTVGRN